MTTKEGNAAIFFAIDHCSLEVVGIHAAKRGTRFEALEPIRQGVRHSFGAFGKDVAKGLTLRHECLIIKFVRLGIRLTRSMNLRLIEEGWQLWLIFLIQLIQVLQNV